MWTPDEGATISCVVGSSSLRRPSENGPVALMIPYRTGDRPMIRHIRRVARHGLGLLLTLALTSHSSPVISSRRRAPLSLPFSSLRRAMTLV